MYDRIAIIGGSGTGKTTLSNILSNIYHLPVIHIDGIHHLSNWNIRDKKERDKIILDVVAQGKWIIDGTYHDTLKQRVENADLIIWLDYSTIAQLKGVFQRYLKNHGKERMEIPGCKEHLTLAFLKQVICFRNNKRHFIVDALNGINSNKILIFKKRKDLNKWINNLN